MITGLYVRRKTLCTTSVPRELGFGLRWIRTWYSVRRGLTNTVGLPEVVLEDDALARKLVQPHLRFPVYSTSLRLRSRRHLSFDRSSSLQANGPIVGQAGYTGVDSLDKTPSCKYRVCAVEISMATMPGANLAGDTSRGDGSQYPGSWAGDDSETRVTTPSPDDVP